MTAHAPATVFRRPRTRAIVLSDVSWATYEMLVHDLQEEHLRLTYDNGMLGIDRRGAEVGAIEPIQWKTYLSLWRDLDGKRNLRLTYDNGRLSIVSPTHRHDRLKTMIGGMIEALALELRIPLGRYGSSTWRPKPGMKGLETDECYYIQNERRVRGKDRINLKSDPPPDLVVEVEVTNPVVKRLPILAALGVPEIWLFRKDQLRAYKLARGKYVPIESSLSFSMLRPDRTEPFSENASLNRRNEHYGVVPGMGSHAAGRGLKLADLIPRAMVERSCSHESCTSRTNPTG